MKKKKQEKKQAITREGFCFKKGDVYPLLHEYYDND